MHGRVDEPSEVGYCFTVQLISNLEKEKIMDNKFTSPYTADDALYAHICGKLSIDPVTNPKDRGVRDIVSQIIRTRSDFSRKAEQVQDAAEWMAREMEATAREAAKAQQNSPYSINNLGVVQGRGSNLDRLCGELQMLSDQLALVETPWDCGEVGVTPVFAEGDEVESTECEPGTCICTVVKVKDNDLYDVQPEDDEVIEDVGASSLRLRLR